jgi:dihydrofolate synthase/folylpolyglutamate synthase
MDRHDPNQEERFQRLLAPFINLERNTARKYADGEYSLDRMPVLARLAGNPQDRLRVVHVAGTKGKGSTCHYATALLVQAGYSVGTFLSPHLATFRERFLLDGQLPQYDAILDRLQTLVATVRKARIQPTFFELLTVGALDFFAETGCEFAVLETGIGGRLDCTNFVASPECTAITAVSFDHTQLLGNTIAEIAREKAGIIKPAVPVVCARQTFAGAERVVRETAELRGAPFHRPQELPETPKTERLVPFQKENLATAVAIAQQCGVTPDWNSLHIPAIPGRFQILSTTPAVVIDSAHNADSARRLAEALTCAFPDVEFVCILGVVAGKDAEGILRELATCCRSFLLTNPRLGFKGSELPLLERLAEEMGLAYQTIPRINDRTDLPPDTPLLFTGSFFTATIGAELFAPPA